MKKALVLLLGLLLLFGSATGESEKLVYGQSVQGRDLVCWRIGSAETNKSVLMVFAVHGFEDEYAADGWLLRQIAEETVELYSREPERLRGYTLYVIPCANPDGLEAGISNQGFGRCNADGYDINRDFSVDFVANQKKNTGKTGPEPFATPEARAIRDLTEQIRPTYGIDVHGYTNLVYCGKSQEMAETFASFFGSKVARWKSGGMLCAWLNEETEAAVLVELRSPLKTPSRSGGSANVLWMPLDDYVKDQGDKLRGGLEAWLLETSDIK